MMGNPSPQEQAFSKYLESRLVLVADASATSRAAIFKLLQQMGAKTANVILTSSYSQAFELITTKRPHVVIAEYELGKSSGLDLLQKQREQRPTEAKESLFILMTGNTSQSAVARAAEEDIDAYIIKPFTPEVVRNTIMKAALVKLKPPEYLLKIEEGKGALAREEWDKAEGLFKAATELDKSPSLALFYLGQTKQLRKVFDQAKGNYERGLDFNKIHYKCMVGLYEVLMTEKEFGRAYDVVKRISQYFPANPKRLAEVLRLAITNKKYEDVEKYYQVFCNIDDRNDMLIRYISAALVVCGKYYLSTKNKARALELFQKAAASSARKGSILKQIVYTLLDFNLVVDANSYLQKFGPETHTSAEFLLSKFQILCREGSPGLAIDKGKDLISKNITDEHLYVAMIQRCLGAKQKAAAEDLLMTGSKKHPEFVKLLETALKNPNAQLPLSGS